MAFIASFVIDLNFETKNSFNSMAESPFKMLGHQEENVLANLFFHIWE